MKNRKYRNALKVVAKKFGLLPIELENCAKKEAARLNGLTECLTPGELGAWPNLSKTRLKHAHSCHECLDKVNKKSPSE